MAEVGKLRLRDGHLIVEGLAGAVLAEVEPDDHMTIDDGTGVAAFVARSFGMPASAFEVRVSVAWYQILEEERGHIDVEAIEVADKRPTSPELEAGDGEG